MILMTARIALTACLPLLAACAPGPGDPQPEPPPQQFVCPADGYLNCMPIVPPERQAYCSGAYREWITANCSNVEIVY